MSRDVCLSPPPMKLYIARKKWHSLQVAPHGSQFAHMGLGMGALGVLWGEATGTGRWQWWELHWQISISACFYSYRYVYQLQFTACNFWIKNKFTHYTQTHACELRALSPSPTSLALPKTSFYPLCATKEAQIQNYELKVKSIGKQLVSYPRAEIY